MHEETLFLAIYIFDRFTQQNMIKKEDIVPVGLTCIFIAGKFEEIYLYSTRLFQKNAGIEKLTKQLMLNIESCILESLNFKLIYICPNEILRRLVFIVKAPSTVGKLSIHNAS